MTAHRPPRTRVLITGAPRKQIVAAFFGLIFLTTLLGGCVSRQSWEATRLLQDIDAGSRPSALKEKTPRPSRTTLRYEVDGTAARADLYEPNQPIGGALVLVPGFTRDGKDDARVVNLATSLARARFLVLVPDVPGSRQLRVRLEDSRDIGAAMVHLADLRPAAAEQGVAVVAISYAVGLAAIASRDVRAQAPLHFLVGIGGYYDTAAVVTYATTGRYRLAKTGPWRVGKPLEAAKWVFLASNAVVLDSPTDRAILERISERCFEGCDEGTEVLLRNARAEGLGPEGLALLRLITNRDPDRVAELLAALPPSVKAQLEGLSLRGDDLDVLEGRLVLVHGRLDPMIPYSESLALATTVPDSEVFVIDGFSHITPRDVGWSGKLQLIDAIQAVLSRRSAPPEATAAKADKGADTQAER
ncbi:alpha/beta fold hydrolase [Pelagibius sp.]|uniref:alpha/beta fold hydrolase n=1 Tax=Pelagibius sp. TaxID=1931238 RepID=UPI003B50E69E